MRVHQLLPTFTPGDAMGQCAVAWQRVLRHLGHAGEIFAGEVPSDWQSLVRPMSTLKVGPDDFVLYHHGIASPLSSRLMHLPARRGVVFHNITPARFYEGTRLEGPLVAGRAQLAALAEAVEVSIGVSRFNAAELTAAGHRNVKVVPLFVEPRRFTSAMRDLSLAKKLAPSGHPRVVSVSRVVPHKRMDDLLSLHEELRRVAPRAETWIVGGYAPGNASFKKLAARAKALGGVRFLGRVSHAELVAAYRSADVFVSMSEHEGFGVPLIEAMAAELPVLAFGAAAVPETMDGRGITFDEKNFAALAELVKVVTEDDELRGRLVAGQNERLRGVSFEATKAALRDALPATPAPKPVSRKKRRIAFVVQRFGDTITGGAEALARQVALQLAPHVELEVFTTCAVDHLTWANELPEGTSRDGRLTVHRFPVTAPRALRTFNRLSDSVFNRPLDFATESRWLGEQGPDAPRLLDAIATRRDDFDAFVFFTYLYAPTVWGLPLVADKAVVVPTAHDEPPIKFQALEDVFTLPQVLLTSTPEESKLIERYFPTAARRRVVGAGLTPLPGKPERFRQRFGIDGPYLLYLGRLEAGKGVTELLARHAALVREFHDAPRLVLAGSGDLKPQGTRVVSLGRIDEESKWDALAGALAVVVPSRYESLSLVTVEAMVMGTPVLGNSASDVVAGQLERSGGGLPYDGTDDTSFRVGVQRLGVERDVFGKAGKKFASKLTWDAVVKAYLDEFEKIGASQKGKKS